MADEVRPKLAQIPQGRDVTPHSGGVKAEEDDEERRHRPKPLYLSGNGSNGNNGNGNGNTVTLPSFREAYGSALAQYPAPPPPPPPPHHDLGGRPAPVPRPYPDSPNGSNRPGPPGPLGPPGPPGPSSGPADSHYARMHGPPEQGYRDNKDYYGYAAPYNPYPDRAPHAPYWPQHQMPPNYQSAPPESAPRQRTSIACKYCRKRKIRCSGYQNTPDGKCTNCKKTGNDCVFQPVSSTTSTAFVPVSAIQGGVPPGTPLYGAFGQPLGPNGGRGPTNPAAGGPPSGAPMNGSGGPPPGYGPTSPGSGGYYQQHGNSPMDRGGPPHGPPPSQHHPPSMGGRQLPLPYPHSHQGYPGEDPQRARTNKRSREEEEAEYPSRLPPPPPPSGYVSHEMGYYRGPEDARRSPPMNGSGSGPGSAVSPSTSAPRGYGAPAPPVLPPPPMSSVGTDSTSVRSYGSISGTAATSPTERHDTRSPSGEVDDRAEHSAADRYSHQLPYLARECEPSAGREIDRTMLSRLGTTRPEQHSDFRGEQKSPQLLRERV